MKTKTIPFDLETAKKIQAGEVEGRIVTNEGNEVEIIRFDLIQNSFPILAIIRIPNVVSDYWEDAKLFQLTGKHGNEKLWLEIELPEEAPKHEFKVGDKVSIDDYNEEDVEIYTIVKIRENLAFLNDGSTVPLEGLTLKELKHEFKPFDKVLVRQNGFDKWKANFFSHMDDGYYKCVNSRYKECILFEGNEHLAGTTDSPK